MKMPILLDSHAHVQFPAYESDRGDVIARAMERGMWMVNVGTKESTSRDAIELARAYPEGIYASVGFHPGHVVPQFHDRAEEQEMSIETFDIGSLRALAEKDKVVGIGECGLDYYRLVDNIDATKAKQEEAFEAQVRLAKELGKPVIVHCRDAFADLIAILKRFFAPHAERSGVIHFFSGSLDDAQELMRLGFFIGFGGVITFAKGYRDIVSEIPLEKILLETDAPYVAPVPHRGQRNEPVFMEATAAKLGEWKSLAFEEVCAATTSNTRHLFSI